MNSSRIFLSNNLLNIAHACEIYYKMNGIYTNKRAISAYFQCKKKSLLFKNLFLSYDDWVISKISVSSILNSPPPFLGHKTIQVAESVFRSLGSEYVSTISSSTAAKMTNIGGRW